MGKLATRIMTKKEIKTKELMVIATRKPEQGRGRGVNTLTPEIAKELVMLLVLGKPLSTMVGKTRMVNIESESIKAFTLDNWLKNGTVPEGAKTSLKVLLDRAKEKYYTAARERRLRAAERVFDEDLAMDTTVMVMKKSKQEKFIGTDKKTGEDKYKIETIEEEVAAISPKLRAIRSQTAQFIANSIGKVDYNTTKVEVNGDNNTININTVSLLQIRARSEEREREAQSVTEGANVIEKDIMDDLAYTSVEDTGRLETG